MFRRMVMNAVGTGAVSVLSACDPTVTIGSGPDAGGRSEPDGGSTLCMGQPFGAFVGSECDAGTLGPLGTFQFNSTGAVWHQVSLYDCGVQTQACEVLLDCRSSPNDMSPYVFDLDWTPSANQLTGRMSYQGRQYCVRLTK